MKHFILETHASFCNCEYCHADSVLFQFNYKFYIVTYPSCLDRFDHLEFKHDIFNQISKRNDGRPVRRGVKYDELKPCNYERLIKKRVNEVIYKYFDNAGKAYHFTQSHNFPDYCKMNVDYLKEIRDANDFIENSEFSIELKKYYLKQIEDMYLSNVSDLSFKMYEDKIVTLNDFITKQIFKK